VLVATHRPCEDRARDWRDAALRAPMAELAARLTSLEDEQQTQFKRIAQLQHQVDELTRFLNKAVQKE
jgi:hypothetical protein